MHCHDHPTASYLQPIKLSLPAITNENMLDRKLDHKSNTRAETKIRSARFPPTLLPSQQLSSRLNSHKDTFPDPKLPLSKPPTSEGELNQAHGTPHPIPPLCRSSPPQLSTLCTTTSRCPTSENGLMRGSLVRSTQCTARLRSV